MDRVRLSAPEGRETVRIALTNRGLNVKDAEAIANHLVEAELRGYPGHGLKRMRGILSSLDVERANSDNSVVVDLPGFLSYKSEGKLGIAAIEQALSASTARTKESGAICVSVTGYTGTTGSLGIYGHELSKLGVVSILMCNSSYAVAPHGSKKAILGTNPIAITMPGSETYFSADFATSAWSYGSIMEAAARGETIPTGIVQSAEGRESTDPNDANDGSQLPMAGHKGYALGLAIELLCGPLIGAKAGRDAVQGSDGFFAILIDSSAVRPAENVTADAAALFDEMIGSPAIDPKRPVRIPGQKSRDAAATTNEFEVDKDLLEIVTGGN